MIDWVLTAASGRLRVMKSCDWFLVTWFSKSVRREGHQFRTVAARNSFAGMFRSVEGHHMFSCSRASQVVCSTAGGLNLATNSRFDWLRACLKPPISADCTPMEWRWRRRRCFSHLKFTVSTRIASGLLGKVAWKFQPFGQKWFWKDLYLLVTL